MPTDYPRGVFFLPFIVSVIKFFKFLYLSMSRILLASPLPTLLPQLGPHPILSEQFIIGLLTVAVLLAHVPLSPSDSHTIIGACVLYCHGIYPSNS